MGKKATKAAGNVYYNARSEAAEYDTVFASRESASEVLGIERTRLANIELGNLTPYPEEVKCMAREYNTPELCNSYCANECPIGVGSVKEVKMDDFDRLSLKVLGSLKDIDSNVYLFIVDNSSFVLTTGLVFIYCFSKSSITPKSIFILF